MITAPGMDGTELPPGKRARNYRMFPKQWREAAQRHEQLEELLCRRT